LDGESDVDLLSELTGASIDRDTTGWAAFSAAEKKLLTIARIENLVRSPNVEISAGARNIRATPAPLRARGRVFDWSRPVVMGIVNVTPDSFSDGGQFLDPSSGIAHGLQLASEGADILDVGGESTRPRGKTYGEGALTVSVDEEIARVVPVIRGLRERTDVPISIDTRKSAVARAALDAGADIVNDVTGLIHDLSLADVVADAGASIVLMHTPRDIEELQHKVASADILGEVQHGLEAALRRAQRIPRERIVLDPGIGFGKSDRNNFYLMKQIASLRALGHPLLVGASRKASIAKAAAGEGSVAPPNERVASSVAAAIASYMGGAQMLRVHDVRATVEAVRVAASIRS
jgi:dihydropteroate synthase